MKEEIYINNKKLDLGGAKITLNHNSNLLGDISTIKASNSLTVALPKTVNNRGILDLPDVPSYKGKYLRKYNDASYFRNGIKIFSGFAVLLSSTDKYEIALSWGELSELTTFLAEKDKLNEYLDDGLTVPWDAINFGTGIIPFYDNGVNDYAKSPLHPSSNLYVILDKIRLKSGLIFNFPTEIIYWLNQRRILCHTKNDSKIAIEENPFKTDINSLFLSQWENISSIYILTVNRYYLTQSNYFDAIFETSTDSYFYKIAVNTQITKIEIKIDIEVLNNDIDVILFIISKDLITMLNPVETYQFTNDSQNSFLKQTINLDISDFDNNSFVFSIHVPDEDILYGKKLTFVRGNIEINVADENENLIVPFPGLFPLYYNLPDITLADFIKNISVLTGTFPHRNVNDPRNVITFSPIQVLYDNKGIAKDWSDKLLYKGAPKQITYKVNDMARSNTLKYKDDEQVSTTASGVITVNDETLPPEKKLFEMAFSASDESQIDNINVIIAKQYEIDENNELQFISINPRIATEKTVNGKHYLDFAGLSFSEIIPQRYVGYQQLMYEPVVLQEDFRLNEIDLRDIDFTIPVYLKQYGKFYAIITIQDTGNLQNIQLLQLN